MRSFTILLLTLCFHYAYGQRHMVVSKQNYSLAVVEMKTHYLNVLLQLEKPMVIKPGEET